MRAVAGVLIILVACIHLYILVLEMFLWTTPRALRAFGLTPKLAEESKALGANQGLYNGFLAAGLIYSLLLDDFGTAVLFTTFVIVAGVYGAITVSRTTLFAQVVPGFLALAAVLLAG
ncbi:DUF1304 domain-containing protein [Lentzea sp. NPDC034063]|uniref:DUF1304 domain-containing protein n=1 Tax=unclassified Lentzea TaxID=2643253 RepID=UPI00340AE165